MTEKTTNLNFAFTEEKKIFKNSFQSLYEAIHYTPLTYVIELIMRISEIISQTKSIQNA